MVSLREMARADAERVPPTWLVPLLKATFFEPCPEHPEASRSTRSGGCNFFCTVCTGRALCHACVAPDHAGHQLIQVRKSSGHNVVKVKDVQALMLAVDEVQVYLINSENVVFLNERPQSGRGKAGEHRCDCCSRALRDEVYRFCSLGCKLECMEWDLDVSFVVQPETESESSEEDGSETEEDTETDDDASSRPTKRLRYTEARSARANWAVGDGAGTSAAATASPATPASNGPSSHRRQQRKGTPSSFPLF